MFIKRDNMLHCIALHKRSNVVHWSNIDYTLVTVWQKSEKEIKALVNAVLFGDLLWTPVSLHCESVAMAARPIAWLTAGVENYRECCERDTYSDGALKRERKQTVSVVLCLSAGCVLFEAGLCFIGGWAVFYWRLGCEAGKDWSWEVERREWSIYQRKLKEDRQQWERRKVMSIGSVVYMH